VSRAGTPTRYKGVTFRSNLESQWAEYFDSMDIIWKYESHTFRLKSINDTVYTPDFYLPAVGMFVEVKPEMETFMEEGLPKMSALCHQIKRWIIAAVGHPCRGPHPFFCYDLDPKNDMPHYEGVCFHRDDTVYQIESRPTLFIHFYDQFTSRS